MSPPRSHDFAVRPAKKCGATIDAPAFTHRIFAGTEGDTLIAAARRADGRFRRRLFEASREGLGVNQREVIETTSIPVAVINGAEDSSLNLDYFDSVSGIAHRL